jgi:hypothetical protein
MTDRDKNRLEPSTVVGFPGDIPGEIDSWYGGGMRFEDLSSRSQDYLRSIYSKGAKTDSDKKKQE